MTASIALYAVVGIYLYVRKDPEVTTAQASGVALGGWLGGALGILLSEVFCGLGV